MSVNTRAALLAISIGISWNISSAQSTVTQDSALTLVQTLFNNASYVSAELEGRRLLEQTPISDSTRVQAEKYVAFALVAQGKNAGATDHFIAAFAIDTSFVLDPYLTSPKIIGIYKEAKTRYLAREEEKRRQRELSSRLASQSVVSFRAVLMPGWEQVYQQRTTKGYVLISLGGASLVSTIVFEFLRASARDEYLSATTSTTAASRYSRYNNTRKAEIYSASIFGIVYLYSVIDSFSPLPPYLSMDYRAKDQSALLSLRLPL